MDKKDGIFIIGPESTGSTYVAKIIASNLGFEDWNGRGFNCCDDAFCDIGNGFLHPCTAVDPIVCHRSLPFGGHLHQPPIEDWKATYNCRFVICTRDISISESSRHNRFGKSLQQCQQESEEARVRLQRLMQAEEESTFVFSFESMLYLQVDYLRRLFDFLEIELMNPPTDIRNENRKYVNYGKSGKKSGLLKALGGSGVI
jgi:hypothetical protein